MPYHGNRNLARHALPPPISSIREGRLILSLLFSPSNPVAPSSLPPFPPTPSNPAAATTARDAVPGRAVHQTSKKRYKKTIPPTAAGGPPEGNHRSWANHLALPDSKRPLEKAKHARGKQFFPLSGATAPPSQGATPLMLLPPPPCPLPLSWPRASIPLFVSHKRKPPRAPQPLGSIPSRPLPRPNHNASCMFRGPCGSGQTSTNGWCARSENVPPSEARR